MGIVSTRPRLKKERARDALLDSPIKRIKREDAQVGIDVTIGARLNEELN